MRRARGQNKIDKYCVKLNQPKKFNDLREICLEPLSKKKWNIFNSTTIIRIGI